MSNVSPLAYVVFHNSMLGKSCPDCGCIYLEHIDANSPIGPYTPIVYPGYVAVSDDDVSFVCGGCYYANHADDEWRAKYPQCRRESADD